MKLVENWRDAWKWFSVHALALPGTVAVAWAYVPDEWRASVPPEWLTYGAIAVTVLGIVGRLVDQQGRL